MPIENFVESEMEMAKYATIHPNQVNKSVLNEKIADLVREKKIEGISDIRDESNREGIRVAIDLRNGVEPETIKRLLYKNTSIESSFGFNTLAIVDGKPKICNLKEFLSTRQSDGLPPGISTMREVKVAVRKPSSRATS